MSKAIMLAAQCGAEVEREWSSQARTTFKSKKTFEAFYSACAAEKDKEIAALKEQVDFWARHAPADAFLEEMEELKPRIAAMEGQEPVAIVDGGVLNWIADRQIQNGLLYAAPTTAELDKAMENWSWSPPKPATVLVELSVEDAKYWSNTAVGSRQLRAACRKALEEMK